MGSPEIVNLLSRIRIAIPELIVIRVYLDRSRQKAERLGNWLYTTFVELGLLQLREASFARSSNAMRLALA